MSLLETATQFLRSRPRASETAPQPVKLSCGTAGLHAFIERTASQGEPIIMADPLCVMALGRDVEFPDGTRGMIIREVAREEYMAWKERLFPGRSQEREGCKFFEIICD